MRSASDFDWLGRHGRTIAAERRPESRIQTGRPLLVKGRAEFAQVVIAGRDPARAGFFCHWRGDAKHQLELGVIARADRPPAELSLPPSKV